MSDRIQKIVTGLADVMSAINTKEAEEQDPMPEIVDEDPTNKKLKEMLCENTGTHILDSGGAYGRSWQRNRHKDFDNSDSINLDVWNDDFNATFDAYHYLKTYLDLDDTAQKLNKEFEEFTNREENKRKYWLELMDEFAESKHNGGSHIVDKPSTTNTYNYDNLLSEVLQYTVFYMEEYEGKDIDQHFILLQIHGGCDVRGGYTNPYIFRIVDMDYFVMAQYDIDVSCPDCEYDWSSDDSGSHWYFEGSTAKDFPLKENIIFDKENNRILCKKCKKDLVVRVMDCY